MPYSLYQKNGVRRIEEEEPVLSSSVQNFPQEAWLLLGLTDCWMQSDDGQFQAPGTIGRWFVWDCLGREGLCLWSSHECRMMHLYLYGMVFGDNTNPHGDKAYAVFSDFY